jgi:integrase
MAVYKVKTGWKFDFQKLGHRFTKTGFPTKEKARTAEAKARGKARMISMAFSELCEKRLDEIKLNRTKKHLEENQRLFKNLTERWATKKEIKRDDVEEYLYEVAEASKQKANKHLRLIKALFNFGLERELVDNNPAARIKPFSFSPVRRYVPPQKDLIKVLSLARPVKKLYLLFLIHTAARMREVNYLRWEDIQDGYVILKTRKARNSVLTERRIPVNQTLKKVIDQIPKVNEWVFPNPDGKPMDYQRKLLKRLCKKAEVKYFSYHALRHFSASKMAEAGAPLTDIQAILGHSRPTTTDIYLRTLKPSLLEATKVLEEIK